jgi:hypothetical protein
MVIFFTFFFRFILIFYLSRPCGCRPGKKFGRCSRVVTVAQLLLLVEDLLVGYVADRKCVRDDPILHLLLLFNSLQLK